MGAVMFTVTRAPTTASFTVTVGPGINGYAGYVPPVIDLVLETETGDYLTLETGDYLAYA